MNRPHLTRRNGRWVVANLNAMSGVFLAQRWCDWKNGLHDWYWRR